MGDIFKEKEPVINVGSFMTVLEGASLGSCSQTRYSG